jgi:nitroreductase
MNQKIKSYLLKFVEYLLLRLRLANKYENITVLKTVDQGLYFSVLLKEYLLDFNRYYINSNQKGKIPENFVGLRSRITAHYHVIEKGLSFENCRPGYGQEMIISLIKHLNIYSNKGFPINDNQYMAAVSTINEYIAFHKNINFNIINIEELFLEYLKQNNISEFKKCGGIKETSKNDILSKINTSFTDLAYSRHTIRSFTNQDVDISEIYKAIRTSMKTPSVCNRQSAKVLILESKEKINSALELQNGNRGFGDKINKLIIVMSDIRHFLDIEERNQHYIDGALFGMSLVYALHSLGLGTCTLNWAVNSAKDKKLKDRLSLPNYFSILFFIGVGHLPEKIKVAFSQQINIDEVIFNA